MRKTLFSLALEGNSPGDRSHAEIDPRHNEVEGRISGALGAVADAMGMAPTLALTDLEAEQSLARQNTELQQDLAESDEVKSALESLCVLAGELRAVMANSQCTPATLRLVTEGANMQLRRIGEPRLMLPALEAAGDIAEQHRQVQVALESAVGRLGQKFVLAGKRHWDVFSDFFASTAGTVRKYEARLANAQKEFSQVKGELPKKTHEVSLTQLHYFFSSSNENWRRWVGATDKSGHPVPGVPHPHVTKDGALERIWTNLPAAIEEDLKISHYVLTKYPADVLALMKQTLGKIGNGNLLQSTSGQEKLEQALAGLKHPVTLFDQKLLKEKFPLFNMTGFEMIEGHYPLWADDDTPLTRLSQNSLVREHTMSGHRVDQAIGYAGVAVAVALPHPFTAGMAAGFVAGDVVWAKNVKFETADIQRVIKCGEGYLKGVEDYFALQKQMASLKDKVSALWDLEIDEDARMVGMTALTFLDNILTCFEQPARDEVGRALKGAQYCQYLALRMMHHAKHGN